MPNPGEINHGQKGANSPSHYYSLLSAIPQEGKAMLKQECSLPSTEYVSLSIEKLTYKIIDNTLLNYQHLPPPTAEKRLLEYGLNFQEGQKIYALPVRVPNEVKLSVFQYKIVHNILCTNKILYKMKRSSNLIVVTAMALIKCHSIDMWNVQLLNCFGINLQIGTLLYVQETFL